MDGNGGILFALLDVVHDWGFKPSEFDLCEPEDDFMLMWGFTRTRNKMQEWTRLYKEAEAKRKSKTKRR